MMSDRGINTVDFEKRKRDLRQIQVLYEMFGNAAYRAMEKYYAGIGYETGVERLVKLIEEGRFSEQGFRANPVKEIEDFLLGYFQDRGGNLPKIWSEGNTVFLMTEAAVDCVTVKAEKAIGIKHRDICNVYCRAEAKGMIKIFEDFFPEISIQYYNASSRRTKEGNDCIEAFQVIAP
jgi:hypothetical protein